MPTSVSKVNFTPLTSVLDIHRRDFPLADRTLVNPSNAVCLVDGEWMTLNASGQAVRASDVTVLGNRASVRAFPLWAERGRYDVQVLGKVPLIYVGDGEFDTLIYDSAVALGAGAAITAALQPVKVATIAIGGRNYTGLVGHGGSADTDPVVGYVTKLPSGTNGMLRFKLGHRSLLAGTK